LADKEHTCSLKRIFLGVHAAAENVILRDFAVAGETLRGFAGSLGSAPKGALLLAFWEFTNALQIPIDKKGIQRYYGHKEN
jgi:hypothetical protein